MRIDFREEAQRRWTLWTAGLLMTAGLAYILYAPRTGLYGGTLPGLIFGFAGYGMMVYAGLLSVRKKFTTWPIGRAATWMRGHLWLGFLSFPLILFHSGFALGGSLTRFLMISFIVVIGTGLGGAALQHFMPRRLTYRVSRETIYDEIGHVLAELTKQADDLLEPILREASSYGLRVPASEKTAVHVTANVLVRLSEKDIEQLRQAYRESIRPFLNREADDSGKLGNPRSANAFFLQLRTVMPAQLSAIIDDLQSFCEEKRDLDRQAKMHRLLHGWLLFHVPLSVLVLILGLVHAVMALRYR